jgi:uncharacterized RDD family membrane protein YckC
VVGSRDVFSWLDGPGRVPGGRPGGEQDYPGQRLGRPAEGPGSVARFGRRLVGVAVDWLLALLIANAALRPLHWGSFAPLAVFFAQHALLVGTVGTTIGHRLVGLRVERLGGGQPGPVKGLLRALLLCLGLPPLIWDADQRGLHDRFPGTLVIRS